METIKQKPVHIKVKTDKIKTENIPINSEEHKIEKIKCELSACNSSPELCEAEVLDMWNDIPESE